MFPYIVNLSNLQDLFYNTNLVIWSHVEVGMALIASSVATLRPFVTKLRIGFGFYRRSRGSEEERLESDGNMRMSPGDHG
jgi:hypothetical protein